MTGFGKASMQLLNKKITVEVKSLNSKNLDLNVRLPQAFCENELKLGKVSFSILLKKSRISLK